MSDERLAAALHDWARTTMPDGAPGRLHVRIAAVPTSVAVATGLSVGNGWLGRLAGSLAIVLVASVLVQLWLGGAGLDGRVGTPTPPTFDPTMDGVGLAGTGISIGPLLLAGAFAGLVALADVRTGWWRVLAVAGMVGLALLALVTVLTSRLEASHYFARGLGHDRTHEMVVGHNGFDVYAIEPGEPFTFGLSARNPGPLPITIHGLAADVPLKAAGAQSPDGIRLTSLGRLRIAGDPHARLADAEAFEPVTLERGQEVFLVILGRGGRCSTSVIPPYGAEAVTEVSDSVPLVVETLGWRHVEHLGMSYLLTSYQAPGCS